MGRDGGRRSRRRELVREVGGETVDGGSGGGLGGVEDIGGGCGLNRGQGGAERLFRGVGRGEGTVAAVGKCCGTRIGRGCGALIARGQGLGVAGGAALFSRGEAALGARGAGGGDGGEIGRGGGGGVGDARLGVGVVLCSGLLGSATLLAGRLGRRRGLEVGQALHPAGKGPFTRIALFGAARQHGRQGRGSGQAGFVEKRGERRAQTNHGAAMQLRPWPWCRFPRDLSPVQSASASMWRTVAHCGWRW